MRQFVEGDISTCTSLKIAPSGAKNEATLNSHKQLHIHTSLPPSLKPKKPTHHVPHLQVHLPSLPLSSLALQSLNPALLPMFLPTCIYSAMSCPVPSSHLTPAGNKTLLKVSMSLRPKLSVRRPKSLETQWTTSLMSILVNICHPHPLL